MAQNHDGSDKVTIKMKILGDAIYDIVIDWLDDDCHPDVQVKRQLASITKIPFAYHRTVYFFLDQLDSRPSTRPDWTRKSTFMNRLYGHQYVLKFDFQIGANSASLGRPDYFFNLRLIAEHLVDENECTFNFTHFCPFIYNISRLKQIAKLANNDELKAELVHQWIVLNRNHNIEIRERLRHATLRRYDVLHILKNLPCKLTQRNFIYININREPYLRTNG